MNYFNLRGCANLFDVSVVIEELGYLGQSQHVNDSLSDPTMEFEGDQHLRNKGSSPKKKLGYLQAAQAFFKLFLSSDPLNEPSVKLQLQIFSEKCRKIGQIG